MLRANKKFTNQMKLPVSNSISDLVTNISKQFVNFKTIKITNKQQASLFVVDFFVRSLLYTRKISFPKSYVIFFDVRFNSFLNTENRMYLFLSLCYNYFVLFQIDTFSDQEVLGKNINLFFIETMNLQFSLLEFSIFHCFKINSALYKKFRKIMLRL